MGRRRRARYYWDGLQFPITAVTVAGDVFEIVGSVQSESKPGTLVRIRGSLCIVANDTTATDVAFKILEVELNDAQAMTGDHIAIDTHEEDIAAPLLWSYYTSLRGATAGQPDDVRQIDIDVKSKRRINPSGKSSIVLLASATTAGRASCSGFLRCCIQQS